jgi:DNA-directed RNA polymerase specialized sigma24 family protein
MNNAVERLTLEEKLCLIKSRARLMGFRRHDLEDAVQEVMITLLEFEYDIEKSNGATETTALTAVIDRKLVSLMRANRCYARLIERATDRLAVECKGFAEGPYREEQAGEELIVSAEVAAALEGLDTVAIQVARLLMDGETPNAIAEQLGMGWQRVARLTGLIRERLEAAGLNPSVTE